MELKKTTIKKIINACINSIDRPSTLAIKDIKDGQPEKLQALSNAMKDIIKDEALYDMLVDALFREINRCVQYGTEINSDDVACITRMIKEAAEAYSNVHRVTNETDSECMFDALYEKLDALEMHDTCNEFNICVADMYNGKDNGEYGYLIKQRCADGHWLRKEDEEGPYFITD